MNYGKDVTPGIMLFDNTEALGLKHYVSWLRHIQIDKQIVLRHLYVPVYRDLCILNISLLVLSNKNCKIFGEQRQ